MKDEHNSLDIEPQQPLPFRTIFDELAEIGELTPLLEEYVNKRFGWNEQIQHEMIDALYNGSPHVIPQVEEFLLDKMCESLSFFIEYTTLCREQSQNL